MTSGKRIYVLDTNVLMHDPTALFKFEEHDIYLPMQVIEELDNGKKGTSEASRNARQVFREERYNYAGEVIVWQAEDEKGGTYVAVFNCGPKPRDLAVQLSSLLGLPEGDYTARDLWAHEEVPVGTHTLNLTVPSHGARLIRLTAK